MSNQVILANGNVSPSNEQTECCICEEMDFVTEMESPCACDRTIKLAHKECIQKLCDEKEDETCETCHERYSVPLALPELRRADTLANIWNTEGLLLPGSPREMHSDELSSDDIQGLLEYHDDEFDIWSSRPLLDQNASARAERRGLTLLIVTLLLYSVNAMFLIYLIIRTIAFYHGHHDDAKGEGDHSKSSSSLYHMLGFLVPSFVTSSILHYVYNRKKKPQVSNGGGHGAGSDVRIDIDESEQGDWPIEGDEPSAS